MQRLANVTEPAQSSQRLRISTLPLLPPPSGCTSAPGRPESVARSLSFISLDRMENMMQPPNKVPHSLNSPTVNELRRRGTFSASVAVLSSFLTIGR
ncbi:unnamed protein product [Schistocephalus solidus]|uniref:Uncharacterized protein n=1 Tax=Schistocephalus solidus TaxID=70667 RepID=A0A183SAT8_SCHSO|nr:unnamed protein product [Schistocephalus solidus]